MPSNMSTRGDDGLSVKGKSHAATPVAPKLSDLGVTKTQSSRWQKLTVLPR
jgi:hypothetical protein